MNSETVYKDSLLTSADPCRLPSLSPESFAMLQSSLFEYFSLEFVNGPAEKGIICKRLASLLAPVVVDALTDFLSQS